METVKKDVDLLDELKKALSSDEPEVEEKPEGASPSNPTEEKTPEIENKDEKPELSEEEISKLTPRAQKRIRDLADQVKALAEKPAEKPEEEVAPEPQEEEPKPAQDFKNVQEFLSAVQDEPSRKLLEKFYGVIKAETSEILSPLEKQNNEAKFEKEFSKYEKIEGLKDYHDDLKKTFLRNPKQSFKALIGETLADLQLARVKPIEKTPSTPNRSGKVEVSKDSSMEDLKNALSVMMEK